MLYNVELKKVRERIDCQACPYMDKPTKKCEGIGKRCFEYDSVAKVCIDPVSKLPIKIN